MHPETKPSNPTIKFIKLIIPVEIKTIKKETINKKKLFWYSRDKKNWYRFEFKNSNITTKSCTKYLIFDDKLILSSIKLTNPNKVQIRIENRESWLKIKVKIKVTNTNTIPPALGLVDLWELLLLGLSGKYFVRKGLKYLISTVPKRNVKINIKNNVLVFKKIFKVLISEIWTN